MGSVEYNVYGHGQTHILAIHGAPGGYDTIEPYVYDLLNTYDCTVVAWSRPGYGNTVLSEENSSFSTQALLCKSICDELDIHKVVIYSIGAGSGIAYHFASLYPDKCLGIIIENGTSISYERPIKTIYQKLVYAPAISKTYFHISSLLCRFIPHILIKAVLTAMYNCDKEELQKMARQIGKDRKYLFLFRKIFSSRINPKYRKLGYFNDLKEMQKEYPLVNVNAQTLIIHGSKNKDVSIKHAEYAKSVISASTLVEVPNAFHLLPLSRNNKTLATKIQFLNLITGKTGNGIDIIVKNQNIPKNWKKFPKQMPMSRVVADSVKVVKQDGEKFSIYDETDEKQENGFVSVMNRYGSLHTGSSINSETFTDIFKINCECGGFVPMMLFPTLKENESGVARICVDNKITDIEIPAMPGRWRAVVGGYFPHEHENSHILISLCEKKMLYIVNPVTDFEAGAPGLYFEKMLTVSFKGNCDFKNNGAYSAFTFIHFLPK